MRLTRYRHRKAGFLLLILSKMTPAQGIRGENPGEPIKGASAKALHLFLL